MFLRYTFIFILLFGFSSLMAQLPNGSEAPDFNLTDLNGNSHKLYEILDQDKSVIIDFSATWCGNCWNYHQTNALDNVYDMYGPDGTDKTQVLWIEADANTSEECITNSSGCMGSTIGDWTNGSNHPYINLDDSNISVKSDYNINSFPTIIGIAPNKKMYNIGKLTNMNTWESWINETFALDYTATIGEDNIDLEVIAGSGDITYKWSNGAETQDISNLDPGSYSCVITEGRGHAIETVEFLITSTVITINCPASINTTCSILDVPSYNSIEDFASAGGQFSGNIDAGTFTMTSEISDNLNCPETVTRTYSIGDASGQMVECTQQIIINDTEAPNVVFLNDLLIPESEIESSKLSTFEEFQSQATIVSDNCGIDEASLDLIDESSTNTICNEIVRTYEILDFCGNPTTFQQTIHIELGSNAQLSFTHENTEQQVTFDVVSNFGDIIEAYSWDFGDNQFSFEPTPTITFSNFGIFNVCLTVSTANCGEKTSCSEVEVKMDVSTFQEQLDNKINIYPNPVEHSLNIFTMSKNLSIESLSILDLKGNIVFTKNEHVQKLDLDTLKTGVYFIRILTNQGISTHKIVKL